MKAQRTGTIDHIVDERTSAVVVSRLVRHPKYGKTYKQSHTFLVDTPSSAGLTAGMTVTIEETRPLSKRKFWRLVTEGEAR